MLSWILDIFIILFLVFLLSLKYITDNLFTTRSLVCKDLFDFTGNSNFLEASISFSHLKEINHLIESLQSNLVPPKIRKIRYEMIRKPYRDLYTSFETLPIYY